MRFGRVLLYGSGLSGAGLLGYKAFLSPDGLDVNNFGVARFGRAAIAVSFELSVTNLLSSSAFNYR